MSKEEMIKYITDWIKEADIEKVRIVYLFIKNMQTKKKS